ncbi:MAG: hypothetical protein K2L07_06835 [Lachnospiraceae bacterium]|nr:hypothetical protein [Lachnospiraceae bacterium]
MGNVIRERKEYHTSDHRRGSKKGIADGKGDGSCGNRYGQWVSGQDKEEHGQGKDQQRKGEMCIVAVDAGKGSG